MNRFVVLEMKWPLTGLAKPIWVAETVWTVDGPRTRMTGHRFTSVEEAVEWIKQTEMRSE